MSFLIGLLTVILVLTCLLLILLVLIQLPKKEAGAGLAFGGAATDALFGAGSGNVLTKITKYAAVTFFVLAMLVASLQSNYQSRTTRDFERQLQEQGTQLPGAAAAPATTPAAGPTVPAGQPAPITLTTTNPADVPAAPAPASAKPE
jgi:preprotein translocase subunit SecG